MEKKLSNSFLMFSFLILHVLFGLWIYTLFYAPYEANMGEVYRVLYVHVPVAFAAFLSAFVLAFYSIKSFRSPNKSFVIYQKACADVGLLMTVLCLATGSIWAKPTWGTWWEWDPRLTTTLLLAILFLAFIMFYHSVEEWQVKRKVCSVIGILIAINVPIVYQSVKWWRSIHQPQSIMREGGSSISPEIRYPLFACIIVMLILTYCTLKIRYLYLELKEHNEMKALQSLKGGQ